jgi:small-conductance mechanosensitive channel
VVVILAMFAIVYTIPSLRSFAFTLFAGAGLLVAILGFAAQKAFSDIISGIFIVAFKPFRVGDAIQAGTGLQAISGTVEDINLRHTTILTSENRRAVIPNAILGEDRIINSSIREEATCEFVEMPVAYNADLDLAMHIMATECVAHPSRLDRRTPAEKSEGHPIVNVRLVRVMDGYCVLRAYVWSRDPATGSAMRYDLNKRILQRFIREGVPLATPPERPTTLPRGTAPTLLSDGPKTQR